MLHHMFTFASGYKSTNAMLMTPVAYNTDATVFHHTGTLYIMWLSMMMDVSNVLKLILSKMVNPCLATSPWIQRTCLLFH
jgi:GH43 family beta-xylosidase